MRLYVPVVLALVIGGALSLFAYSATRDWEEARARRGFEREVIVHAANLRQEISSTIEGVHAIRALYGASKEVERDEFRAFAAVEMEEEHRGIQALEWIPRVAAADRAAFEAAARADGLAGFRFTERESQGHMVAAAARAVYFPVYFVEPLAGNESAVGFDLGSNPARLAALNEARDSGKTVATGRITLVQGTGDQYGFLVFEPIYAKGAPAGISVSPSTKTDSAPLFEIVQVIVWSAAAASEASVNVTEKVTSPGLLSAVSPSPMAENSRLASASEVATRTGSTGGGFTAIRAKPRASASKTSRSLRLVPTEMKVTSMVASVSVVKLADVFSLVTPKFRTPSCEAVRSAPPRSIWPSWGVPTKFPT